MPSFDLVRGLDDSMSSSSSSSDDEDLVESDEVKEGESLRGTPLSEIVRIPDFGNRKVSHHTTHAAV